MKASLRSQNASASLEMVLSAMPGTSSRLKMASLSSALSWANTPVKSLTLKVVHVDCTFEGSCNAACPTGTKLELGEADTVTSCETGLITLAMK